MNRVRAWAGRVAAWCRRQALWLANQRALHAHNVQLERQVAAMRAEHEKELAAFFAMHDEGMTAKNDIIADLRRENTGWQQWCGELQAKVQHERRLGNRGWQEFARVNREREAERKGAQHAAAAVGD